MKHLGGVIEDTYPCPSCGIEPDPEIGHRPVTTNIDVSTQAEPLIIHNLRFECRRCGAMWFPNQKGRHK